MSPSLCPVMTSSPLKRDPGSSKTSRVVAPYNLSHGHHSSVDDDDIPLLTQAEANSFFSEENEIDIDDDTSDLILSNEEIESFFHDSFESEDATLTQAVDLEEKCTDDSQLSSKEIVNSSDTTSNTEEVTLTQAEIDSFFAAEEEEKEFEISELDLPKEEIDSFAKSFFSSDSD